MNRFPLGAVSAIALVLGLQAPLAISAEPVVPGVVADSPDTQSSPPLLAPAPAPDQRGDRTLDGRSPGTSDDPSPGMNDEQSPGMNDEQSPDERQAPAGSDDDSPGVPSSPGPLHRDASGGVRV